MATDVPPPPPDAAPVAAIVAPAETAAPITTTSNGFNYTITGNTLLNPEVIVAAVQRAWGPPRVCGTMAACPQGATPCNAMPTPR